MTDLQCAARLYVARHGEAVYESELLSDAGGWLSPWGRQQAADLGTSLVSGPVCPTRSPRRSRRGSTAT